MPSRKWIVLLVFLALFTFMVEVRSSSVTLEEVIELLQKSITALESCNYNCTGVFSHSSILSGNAAYQSQLSQLLTPVVKLDSEWVPCYLASTHGWAARTFHSRCDGKNHTVTIIKVGVYVFGGYTDIPWDSNGQYGYTTNAFIFSLRNNEGLGPFKSMVARPSRAIVGSPDFGPIFGEGYDICIFNNANSNRLSYTDFGEYNVYPIPSGVQHSSSLLAGSRLFTPDELEVFYLL